MSRRTVSRNGYVWWEIRCDSTHCDESALEPACWSPEGWHWPKAADGHRIDLCHRCVAQLTKVPNVPHKSVKRRKYRQIGATP